MVNLYVFNIVRGTLTLEQVPTLWREDVRIKLIEQGYLEEE